MKVSVVIPAYNEEKYIGTCLESLMQQEIKPDEIIVVNNNSTDKTVEIATKFPVRLVHEKEQGMIPARNRGFNEAKYEIIARTDSDSKTDPQWVKHIKQFFEQNPEYDAVSGASYYDTLPDYINAPIFNRYLGTLHIVLGYYPLVGPNLSMKKTMWNKIKDQVCLDDTMVHEDIDLSIHIDQVGGQIGYDPSIKVYTSTRRLVGNPTSFFLEYPQRVRKMLKNHGVHVRELRGVKKPSFNFPSLPKKLKRS